jgi:hypothetical protein
MAWNLGVPYGIGVLGASVHTYYDILNVSRSSEEVVIRAAYRALIAKYHPDRFRGDAAEADRMAKLINEAYAVLSDPHRRAAYDRKIGATGASKTHESKTSASATAQKTGGEVHASKSTEATFIPSASHGFRHPWLLIVAPGLACLFAQSSERATPPTVSPPLIATSDSSPVDLTSAAVPQQSDADLNTLSEEAANKKWVLDPPQSNPSTMPPNEASTDSVGEDASQGTESNSRPDSSTDSDGKPNARPPLTSIGREDRQTIELACVIERSNGPVRYNACLRRNYAALKGVAHPDLNRLNREDRQTVELACIGVRSDGPAIYNRCLARQSASVNSSPYPDMSHIDSEDRQTIELACIAARSDGPTKYNGCLRSQLSALMGR